jgi:serine/threonine protein kinase/DNA-binding response OmpR family regulator
MKVLIAEDEPGCRLLLDALLTDLGYEVVVCEDGQAAWTVLQQPDAPRIAILDWMMPGMNGLQVCRAVREQAEREYTYVVLLTAKTQKKDLVSAFQAGADDFLTKPVDEDQLRARLHAAQRILGDNARRAKSGASAPAPGSPAPGAPVSAGEFLSYLTANGLQGSHAVPPGAGGATHGAALARELVAAGKLTPFQADALLDRRFNDLRVGNYEILDRLGAGGMGTVFKARHRRMKRVVALKLITRGAPGDEVFAQRFQREVETIARLQHPNIVMAFDADESPAGPFLVMEFVDGRNLASAVATDGPLPVEQAVGDVLQAARGLVYAHSCGIVHRDIKPENLLRDTAGVVKVADLGLARLSATGGRDENNAHLTTAGTVVGTAQYMAPEQAVESAVDHRADVYGLGCALHFLLTGRPPYAGDSAMAVFLKHRDDPIPSLRDARADVPPELDAVFQRMLAKWPEDRYPSMAEVVNALERVRSVLVPGAGPVRTDASRSVPPATAHPRTEIMGAAGVAPVPGSAVSEEFSVSATASPLSPGGLAVVLAEPSASEALIVTACLQQLGVGAVHTTGSGQQALELIGRSGARVLLSAPRLSDMTGAELVGIVRADPKCADVGIILTADSSDSEATAARPKGPRTALVYRPFDLERLFHALMQVARAGG